MSSLPRNKYTCLLVSNSKVLVFVFRSTWRVVPDITLVGSRAGVDVSILSEWLTMQLWCHTQGEWYMFVKYSNLFNPSTTMDQWSWAPQMRTWCKIVLHACSSYSPMLWPCWINMCVLGTTYYQCSWKSGEYNTENTQLVTCDSQKHPISLPQPRPPASWVQLAALEH